MKGGTILLTTVFEKIGAILLGKFGMRLVEFVWLCPRLAWVSFYGPCYTWTAGQQHQVILLVWHFACEMSICEQNKVKRHALLFFSLFVFWYDFVGFFGTYQRSCLFQHAHVVIYVLTLNFWLSHCVKFKWVWSNLSFFFLVPILVSEYSH